MDKRITVDLTKKLDNFERDFDNSLDNIILDCVNCGIEKVVQLLWEEYRYADGYMAALLDLGLIDKEEYISLIQKADIMTQDKIAIARNV